MKVLIIDDEPIVRRALARAFERRGHMVVTADGGRSGLAEWRAQMPEVVMIDVLMPDLNGPRVLEEIQSDLGGQSSAYIVLMSAFTGEFDYQRAKSYGANEFLGKPFEDIFEVVERVEKEVGGNI